MIIPTASCDDTSQRQQHKPGAAAAAGAPGRRGTRCRPRGNGGGGGSSKSSPRLQRKNQSVTSSSSSSSTALNSRSRLSLPNIANSKSCLSSNTELSSSEDVDLVSESSQEFATPTDVDQGDPPSQTGLNYKWSSNTFKLELDLPDRKTLSQNPFTGQKSKGLKKRTRPSSGVEKGKSVKGQSVQVSGLSRRGRSADNTATLNGKPLVEQTDALSITPMMTSRDAEMASQDVHMASPEGTAPSTDVNMTLRDAGHSSKDVSASSKKKREQVRTSGVVLSVVLLTASANRGGGTNGKRVQIHTFKWLSTLSLCFRILKEFPRFVSTTTLTLTRRTESRGGRPTRT